MGLLFKNDRRTEREEVLPVVDWTAALTALSNREPMVRVACLSGLQPSDAQAFMEQASAAHAVVVFAMKAGSVRDRTEAETLVRTVTGKTFPVEGFVDLLMTNAGADGKKATWAQVVAAALTEAV